MAAQIMTTAEVAAELDTTTRTLRKFLRSDASGVEGVGKGSRYSIEKKQMRSLRSRFEKWTASLEKATDDAPDAPEDDSNE